VAAALTPLVQAPQALAAEVQARRSAPGAPVIVHRSDDLTVLALEVAAGFVSPPHDHRLWAVVGVYQGAEDNIFYRASPEGLEQTGCGVLEVGQCLALGPDAVHRIANRGTTPLLAIHVYGGDLFATSRSQWDERTGERTPFGSAR
jgi:predicted metal-dependent enzyme (double-stranded beta helix superfamily)